MNKDWIIKTIGTLGRVHAVFENDTTRKADVMEEVEQLLAVTLDGSRTEPIWQPDCPVIHDEYNCSHVYALLAPNIDPRKLFMAGNILVDMDGNVTLGYALPCPGAYNSLLPETWAKLNAGMEYAYKLAAEKRAGVKHGQPEQNGR